MGESSLQTVNVLPSVSMDGQSLISDTASTSEVGTSNASNSQENRSLTASASDKLLESENKADNEREVACQCEPITVLQVLRGVVVVSVLFVTGLIWLAILAPFEHVIRGVNRHLGRKLAGGAFNLWLSMPTFNFEKIIGAKVSFAGDEIPSKERVVIICNHRTELDWMYIWNLAIRKGRLGYVKYALKSSVRNYPLFGWAFHVLEFLFLDRKWEKDEANIRNLLSTFLDRRDPLWFVIFPEGTDYSEKKRQKSVAFARDNGLPELQNVLLPRHRGFAATLDVLSPSIDAVYDLTIGYKKASPEFLSALLGTEPSEVHIHVKRYAMADMPSDAAEISAWLYDKWQKKDELLAGFYREGQFPGVAVQDELSLTRGIATILGFILLSAFVLVWAYHAPWLRWYLTGSTVFLCTATYFQWRMPTVL
eukprot:jgi/Mesen1/1250/ME000129S00352